MTAGHCGWFQPYSTPHSLMSPALQLNSCPSSYFQFLLVWLFIETALRETLERCLSDPRSRIRPKTTIIHHRADPSVTYAIHPFGFIWFFLSHVFEILLLESYAELKEEKKKKLTFSLGWRTDTRNDFCQISRFWSSWIWQGNSRQRTLQKPVIELFLLYSFCTILMRKQNKNMTLKWNFYFISQVEPLKSTLDVF